MNEKPEALKLAEYLVDEWYGLTASYTGLPMVSDVAVAIVRVKAAAELRRLHAENERLREEVRLLRLYGNKDCTAMADEAMKEAALRREETT